MEGFYDIFSSLWGLQFNYGMTLTTVALDDMSVDDSRIDTNYFNEMLLCNIWSQADNCN